MLCVASMSDMPGSWNAASTSLLHVVHKHDPNSGAGHRGRVIIAMCSMGPAGAPARENERAPHSSQIDKTNVIIDGYWPVVVPDPADDEVRHASLPASAMGVEFMGFSIMVITR